MADDQNNFISSDKLNDLLGILGGGGVAGTLISGNALKKLGGAKSMHPALAETLGWKGSLTHPDAIDEQRFRDQFITNNMQNYRTANPRPSMIDTAHRDFGWQYGPVMGLSKELPDTGLALNLLKGKRAMSLSHPEGDVLGAHGIDPNVKLFPRYKQAGAWGTFDPDDKQINMLDILKNRPFHPQGQLADWGTIKKNFPGDFPWKQFPEAIAAHELQHGIQDYAGQLENYRKESKPFEQEARGVEFRYLHPEAYQYPFNTIANDSYNRFRNSLYWYQSGGN